MAGKRRFLKRFLITLAVLFLALAALVLTYSHWLPGVARPIAGRLGATYRTFERAGDGRFVITDLVRTNELFDLRVSQIEGFLPHAWYFNLRRDSVTNEAAYLEVDGWRVTIHDTERERDEPDVERSTYQLWKQAERYIGLAREWLPKATLLNGSVVFQDKDFSLPLATWDRGLLDANGTWPVSAVPIEIKGRLTGEGPYQLSYAMHTLDLRARLRLIETNDFLNAQLAAFYRDNRADLIANFATNGLLPESARLTAADFQLPGELLKLEQYSEVTGSLSSEWQSNRYALELEARAEPFSSATNLPSAEVNLALAGDTNRVRVERAISTLPGLQITVSDPIDLSYEGTMLSERSEIQVNAELEKLPWLDLNGRVNGTILLEKGSKFPGVTFNLGGAGLSGYDLEVENLAAQGRLEWPVLERFTFDARLAGNANLSLSGSADLEQRILRETQVNAGGPIATNLLPEGIHFSSVQLRSTLSGALTNLQHSGEFELREFQAPQLQPITLQASWKAEHLAFDSLALLARAGAGALSIRGSGYAGGGRTNFIVRELSLLKGDEAYLRLAEPARITLSSSPGSRAPAIEIRPITLTGTNRHLTLGGGLIWPEAGAVELRATNINPSIFQFFFTRSLSGLDLERFNLSAAWSNSPLAATINGLFSVQQAPFERLAAGVEARLDTNGLAIQRTIVSSPGGEILRARGFLPLRISVSGTNRIDLSPVERIDFAAETTSNPALWDMVASMTPLKLSNAVVSLNLKGTPSRPTGELRVEVDAVRLTLTNQLIPAIGPVDARVLLDQQELQLRDLSLRIEDQPFTIGGTLPLGEGFWEQRPEELLNYALTNVELRVSAPDVKLAPFAAYLPKYLREQGELFINAEVHPGLLLDGRIQVRNVETRPLPRLGVVQEIEAELLLRGQEIQVANMSGVLGGERLSLGGRIDLSPASLEQTYPNVDLSIAGYNLPLARNPDVILRSDLNLRITNGPAQIPVISGTANLRDSFLLRDITTLVPGRVASPERRPPYFTVAQEPLNEWGLDIRVRGDNFMRIRSPFFQGVVSANFHVVGDLEEPMALGEAAITSGRIIFPFASLEIRQALVSLTSENPYLPHVFVVAAGRAFGFDLRMEAEGPADEPIIEFSSVPALTSEQILLMITTGQIPRDDFGFSNQDRASRLAFFLGKSLWAKLNPGEPTEERLTIRSGQDVTEQGKQTYEVEYKLTDRWSLVGEYDRFGELNANVKWRLFSR